LNNLIQKTVDKYFTIHTLVAQQEKRYDRRDRRINIAAG
jgi:hypothetical protein